MLTHGGPIYGQCHPTARPGKHVTLEFTLTLMWWGPFSEPDTGDDDGTRALPPPSLILSNELVHRSLYRGPMRHVGVGVRDCTGRVQLAKVG